MRYAEVQVERGQAPLLVAFDTKLERDEAAAAFGGAYFADMGYRLARQRYDLRRYDNPRYCKSIEIGGFVYEAILRSEDAKHEELATLATMDTHDELRHRLELILALMDEEAE